MTRRGATVQVGPPGADEDTHEPFPDPLHRCRRDRGDAASGRCGGRASGRGSDGALPLAELVKIEPKAIGVGQHRYDVDEHRLGRSLAAVVEDAVNAVGVDLNTASAPLLARVSGAGPGLAEAFVAQRDQNGPFASRKDLLKVARLGPKAFEQAAGFLRTTGGKEPLDASSLLPEAVIFGRSWQSRAF